tara:strand:+ start:1537 stop:1842 length:306 start_codon:yes stop_codon:yes gene_type:complete
MPHLQWKKKKKIKIKNEDYYNKIDYEVNPDHHSAISGIKIEIEKDIEKDKKIDPAKVFDGYKGGKNSKKKDKDLLNDKNKKKLLSMDKNLSHSSKVIKYGL